MKPRHKRFGHPRWRVSCAAWGLALLLGLTGGLSADARPRAKGSLATFRARVDAMLHRNGLEKDRVGLLIYSPRRRRYLYRANIRRPMIAASNIKLVTSYAALRVLSPRFRFQTRFYLVEENLDREGGPRQGLVVEGSGDPTLTRDNLEHIALVLKSTGIARLPGGIFFDGALFDEVVFPGSWGDVSRGQPWFAPVSPFIVANNVIDFVIATRKDGRGFEAATTTPGFQVSSSIIAAPVSQPKIRVEQQWWHDGATFKLRGKLAPSKEPYQFSAAVERPRVHFFRHLRAGLVNAGVVEPIPYRQSAPPARKRLLHTHYSPPLWEMLVDLNKDSSNLAAEVLVRTLALQERAEGVSAQDGLDVLKAVMEKAFWQASTQLRMVDGSGLSRENQVSPLLLVRLLNRVRGDFSIRPEFVNSLSTALVDGTLQFRDFPPALRGRMRAKSGSLKGVSNLSGYLQLKRDVVIFSFMIHHPGRSYQDLQEAQDRVMGELYQSLLELEAG